MEERKILKVYQRTQRDGLSMWHVRVELDDGRMWHHIIPDDAFEWRAAEYGIDPDDVDQILDILLHESFIPSPFRARNFKEDAAAKKGLVVRNNKVKLAGVSPNAMVPATLYNANSRQQARDAHMARIEEVKSRVRFTPHPTLRSGTDPLDVIRKNVKLNRESVLAKATIVEAQFNEIMGFPVTGDVSAAKKFLGMKENRNDAEPPRR